MWHIPDPAWKFGCGRYIQKPDAILDLPAEIARLGGSALILCGRNARNASLALHPGLLDGIPHREIEHTAPCSEAAARRYAQIAREDGWKAVVGVGGGKIMDLAKLTGDLAGLPVVNVPTICATCAAFTPLSVMYSEEGAALGTWFFETEIACLLVDTRILARQPLRYAMAGLVDSLAKKIEITHNSAFLPKGPDMAYARFSAQYLYEQLEEIALRVPAALAAGEPCDTVERLAYLTIPVTGLVSGCARGQGQSALAHALYESVRTLFTREAADALHGELVGVGLRAQLRYDGLDGQALDAIMTATHMPMTLHELGVSPDEDALDRLTENMLTRDMIHPEAENAGRLREALRYVL